MSEMPMRDDELPSGSMFVSFHFDPDVVPTHPKTGEPIPPPDCITAVCRPEAVGWAKARLTSLVNSTGWRAELTERYVYKEDADEPSVQDVDARQ